MSFQDGGGAIRPLLWDGGAKELHRNPTDGPLPKVCTRDKKMEEVVPKMTPRRGSDAGQSKR